MIYKIWNHIYKISDNLIDTHMKIELVQLNRKIYILFTIYYLLFTITILFYNLHETKELLINWA